MKYITNDLANTVEFTSPADLIASIRRFSQGRARWRLAGEYFFEVIKMFIFWFGFVSGVAALSAVLFIIAAISRGGNREYNKKIYDLNIRIRDSVESTDGHLIDILERLSNICLNQD